MGTWLILILITGIIILNYLYKDYKKYGYVTNDEKGFSFIIFILCSLISCLGVLLISSLVEAVVEPESVLVEKRSVELVAMKDNSNIRGSFFLGTGSVGEELKYHYMKKVGTANGRVAYKAASVYANEVIVVETNDETPRITLYDYRYKNKLLNFLFLNTKRPVKEVVVPVGSVVQNLYEVDLE